MHCKALLTNVEGFKHIDIHQKTQQFFLYIANDYAYFTKYDLFSGHILNTYVFNSFRNSGLNERLMYNEADMVTFIFCLTKKWVIDVTKVVNVTLLCEPSCNPNSILYIYLDVPADFIHNIFLPLFLNFCRSYFSHLCYLVVYVTIGNI